MNTGSFEKEVWTAEHSWFLTGFQPQGEKKHHFWSEEAWWQSDRWKTNRRSQSLWHAVSDLLVALHSRPMMWLSLPLLANSDRLGPADVSSDSWALMACFTLALFSVKCTITENNLIASNKCPVFIPFKEHLAFPLKRRSLIRRWLSGSRTWGSWKRWGNTGSLSGKGTKWHWGGS